MNPRSLRIYAAVAAVPATAVIVAHLAYEWRLHPASAERQSLAFRHGIALAVVLAAVLAAGRVALRIGRPPPLAVADVVAVGAAIAILAHLAAAWRTHSVGDLGLLGKHLAALGALALGTAAVQRRARRPPGIP